ncbi:MAG: hypothetical protein Q9222_002961 [Ikaeria aurantiellina]
MADFHCVHADSWRTRLFEYGDCFSAIRFMEYTEGVFPHFDDVSKEFISTRASRPSRQFGEPIVTPRKYVVRKSELSVSYLPRGAQRKLIGLFLHLVDTCTLAILMRSDTHPGDLPWEGSRSPIISDISSYKEIAQVGDVIYNMCGKGLRSSGWASTGQHKGVALAFWATNSAVDRRYPNVKPVPGVPGTVS